MKKFSIGDCRLATASDRFPLAILGRMAVAPIPNRQSPIASAFSLVEVVLALGIVSFCLLAIVGLLPVGLKAVKNANEQAAAANVLNAIADSLRSTTSSNAVNFAGSFGTNQISFSLGGAATNLSWSNLKLDGSTESSVDPKRISAVVNITPPANLLSSGQAVISVAWPAQANPIWDATTRTWSKAEGSVTTAIQFLPKP